eukprot:jgi/Ulvmu1/665/UM010_0036.1
MCYGRSADACCPPCRRAAVSAFRAHAAQRGTVAPAAAFVHRALRGKGKVSMVWAPPGPPFECMHAAAAGGALQPPALCRAVWC